MRSAVYGRLAVAVDTRRGSVYIPALDRHAPGRTGFPDPRRAFFRWVRIMKVINSLKSAKKRERNCRVIRRRGRVYVINKKNPRFKARQG